MSIVFRREIAKIRSVRAEQAQANEATIFSGVSMTVMRRRVKGEDKIRIKNPSYSSLAQSVERMTVNHDVAGSSPAGGANEKPEAIASGFFVGSLVDLQSTIL